MKNNWHKIWDNRDMNLSGVDMNDENQVIIALKKIVGWDFFGKGANIAAADFRTEYEYVRDNLKIPAGASVFEVGCGSGANLYFLRKDGFKIGASDYSANLLAVAQKVIGEENLIECVCCDAAEIPTDIKYDAVIALSIFHYFNDLDHTEKVLDRMVTKATRSVAITDILNEETKENCLKYRRETTPNYDELYKDLPKLFISKKFFIDYAAKNNLDVAFSVNHLEGYWNAPFSFDCFLYKK